ncbi:MAG TPA: hypothetical protein VFR58_07495 [Flavisolibacter sp.]|nr:hypothetical protein [Flavisolibacter sp.]
MKRTVSLMAFAMILLASCKKENQDKNESTPASSVIGFWVGSYTTNGMLGNNKYAMLINAGGTGRVYDISNGTDTATMSPHKKMNLTWTLDGNIFETTYGNGAIPINTKATVNDSFSNMTGTWSVGANEKGTITLNK